MKFTITDGLPFVRVTLEHAGQLLTLDNVLLDSGSMTSLFSADRMEALGLFFEPGIIPHAIRGVGGREYVFPRTVDCLRIGEMATTHFEIEIGAMDYGFEIDGILGLNFLLAVQACLDFGKMEIYPSQSVSA